MDRGKIDIRRDSIKAEEGRSTIYKKKRGGGIRGGRLENEEIYKGKMVGRGGNY